MRPAAFRALDPPGRCGVAVNELFAQSELLALKPMVSALLLPPVPLLFAIAVGAAVMGRGRRLGAAIIGASLLLLWLSATTGAAERLERVLLDPPPAIDPQGVQALRSPPTSGRTSAIVVLGGGMEPMAPEYGSASLRHASLERLRYGVWLARRTGLPLAFSGGLGHAQSGGDAEARVAARIATQEYGVAPRWVEERSRDTRENAAHTVALLRESGIQHIVLVTHGWHMPRAQRAFRQAAGAGIDVEAAPMGLARRLELPVLRWLPSSAGFRDTRHVLHEWIGLRAGA